MNTPGSIVTAKNRAHSNELLTVKSIENELYFIDVHYGKIWKSEDYRLVNKAELDAGVRQDIDSILKYHWCQFPTWSKWAFIQPNRTLVLSNQRPHGYHPDYGFYFLSTNNTHQTIELIDHPYSFIYSSSSLECKPCDVLADTA